MRRPGFSCTVCTFALLLTLGLSAACTPGAAPAATPTVAAFQVPTATAAPTATPVTAPSPTALPTVTAVPTVAASPTPVSSPWWNDRVFYEIFVRSFQDSNGDGIGDFKGLISRLDYLNDGDPNTNTDLGITGIWLMPIMPSPSYHGYDVTDYKAINPQYGTMDDFKQFLAEAHKRGIAVIIDLVLNHTSSKHPWFLEAIDPKSPKRDWYVWSADAKGANWHDVGQADKYYGFFGAHMPDLNYKNPAVTDAMFDVAKFWLSDVKIDGFRLDAIKYLQEEGRVVENAPGTLEWFKQFHTYTKRLDLNAYTVGEVWSESMVAKFYVPDRVDTVFEFSMAEAMIQSAQRGDRTAVERMQKRVNDIYPSGQFATFLANHDQERTRSRLADEQQAFTAASLQLLYGGVPFIYYGEEIGMQGAKPDESIRRPMQWTPEGGFTTGKPWNDYFEDVQTRNVAGQEQDPASLLSHYRSLIRLRQTYPALRTGDWRLVSVSKELPAVYSFMRSLGDERFLVVINLGNQPVTGYQLSLEAKPGANPSARPVKAEIVYGPKTATQDVAPIVTDGFESYQPIPNLPPYSTFVIRYSR